MDRSAPRHHHGRSRYRRRLHYSWLLVVVRGHLSNLSQDRNSTQLPHCSLLQLESHLCLRVIQNGKNRVVCFRLLMAKRKTQNSYIVGAD